MEKPRTHEAAAVTSNFPSFPLHFLSLAVESQSARELWEEFGLHGPEEERDGERGEGEIEILRVSEGERARAGAGEPREFFRPSVRRSISHNCLNG